MTQVKGSEGLSDLEKLVRKRELLAAVMGVSLVGIVVSSGAVHHRFGSHWSMAMLGLAFLMMAGWVRVSGRMSDEVARLKGWHRDQFGYYDPGAYAPKRSDKQ